MDQEKIKKVVVAIWIIGLFVFAGYVVKMYAKGTDSVPAESEIVDKVGSSLDYYINNPEVSQEGVEDSSYHE